jgi:hypothetical protein
MEIRACSHPLSGHDRPFRLDTATSSEILPVEPEVATRGRARRGARGVRGSPAALRLESHDLASGITFPTTSSSRTP